MTDQSICQFDIIGREGIPRPYLALGGIKGETGDVQILFVPENAASVLYALPFALTLTDDRAIRTGHLPIPMQKAFEACEAGNNFTFRSMSFSKLSVDEVREHVEGQQIRDSSAPEITSPAP